jgi:hypothetical protein
MNPLSRVHARLDENETFVEELIELAKRAVRLLEKDLLLQLRAEDYLVAADEAQVG